MNIIDWPGPGLARTQARRLVQIGVIWEEAIGPVSQQIGSQLLWLRPPNSSSQGYEHIDLKLQTARG